MSDYVFCYWDDPIEWRNDIEARHNNRIQNLFKKQEVSDKNLQEHTSGRHIEHDKEKANSSKRVDY